MQTNIETLPTLATLTGEQIAENARAAGEPAWLITWRVAAWNHFAQATPPQWRRTNLTRLQPEVIRPQFVPQGTLLETDTAVTEQGVIFMTLSEAIRHHGDRIREVMGTAVAPETNKFSALRAALWQDGIFVWVPRNTEVVAPLQARYVLPDGVQAIFPYSVIILEPNARVTFVEEFVGEASTENALVAPTTEVFAGPGSEIRYITIQDNGANVHHIGGQQIVLDRDAGSEWVSLSLGGLVQHVEAETRMQGDGSRVNWLGATLATGEQNLVNSPWLRHVSTANESNMDFRTVVSEKGYSVFDGMIKIDYGSHATVTRLEQHAVHLSDTARSDSIPGLKIDTNDVASAGHASTSGEVDEDQLFYMQARGIDRDEARRLIVMGFFEPALDAIPIEELRERIVAAIEAKI